MNGFWWDDVNVVRNEKGWKHFWHKNSFWEVQNLSKENFSGCFLINFWQIVLTLEFIMIVFKKYWNERFFKEIVKGETLRV